MLRVSFYPLTGFWLRLQHSPAGWINDWCFYANLAIGNQPVMWVKNEILNPQKKWTDLMFLKPLQ